VSDDPKRPAMGSIMAYLSLALAISAQAGAAIWWAGVVNARVEIIERDLVQLRQEVPVHTRELQQALRSVAVLEERLVRIDENLARLAAAVERAAARVP
jgi:hypothetical protein